jgi:hypothetical protein
MTSRSPRRDPLAFHKGPPSSGRPDADRLVDQARQGRLAPGAVREGWPDFVFAFNDADEIGPRMLERIARHTGLATEDL